METNASPIEEVFYCSFCGHPSNIENDETILILGSKGANICERCILKCAQAIIRNRTSKETENIEHSIET